MSSTQNISEFQPDKPTNQLDEDEEACEMFQKAEENGGVHAR